MALVIFTLCFAFTANASFDRKGNGGDALVCYNSKGEIRSVRLLDYYEALQKQRIKSIELGEKEWGFHEKVLYALNRLETIDYLRAQKYKQWYKDFFNQDEFSWGENLVNIADTGALSIPNNCEIKQIAVQEAPSLPGDKRYIINKSLWSLMDEDNKAGLILHELIYREVISEERCGGLDDIEEKHVCSQLHINSKRVRYYNSLISSSEMAEMSEREYHQFLIEALMQRASKNSLPLYVFRFKDNGILPAYGTSYDENGNVHLVDEIDTIINPGDKSVGTFYENYDYKLNTQFLNGMKTFIYKYSSIFNVNNNDRPTCEYEITFFKSGVIECPLAVLPSKSQVPPYSLDISPYISMKVSKIDKSRLRGNPDIFSIKLNSDGMVEDLLLHGHDITLNARFFDEEIRYVFSYLGGKLKLNRNGIVDFKQNYVSWFNGKYLDKEGRAYDVNYVPYVDNVGRIDKFCTKDTCIKAPTNKLNFLKLASKEEDFTEELPSGWYLTLEKKEKKALVKAIKMCESYILNKIPVQNQKQFECKHLTTYSSPKNQYVRVRATLKGQPNVHMLSYKN